MYAIIGSSYLSGRMLVSRTDNTRPVEIVERDASALVIKKSWGKITITGGVNSENGHGKAMRNQAQRKLRQRQRTFNRKAAHRAARGPEEIGELAPTSAVKRSVGWRQV